MCVDVADKIEKGLLGLYERDAGSRDALQKRRYHFANELRKWELLLRYTGDKRGRLLDCGFGSGRDILIATSYKFETYGCDACEKYCRDFAQVFPDKSKNIKMCNIKNLLFEDGFFDVVRHNASFLHMPLISSGYTVHKVLEETNRVLKEEGIVYIYTKAGEGFTSLDTGEGFGPRPFQYYTCESLSQLLLECGFEVLHCEKLSKERKQIESDGQIKTTSINWIESIARKVKLL